MTDTQIKVSLEGNFFRNAPGKTFYENLETMLDKLAGEMQADVMIGVAAHAGEMPYYSGWSYDHVRGYTTSPFTGKNWVTWAAVGSVTAGMSKKDAIRTKAAAASIERRFHPYANEAGRILSSRVISGADLTYRLE